MTKAIVVLSLVTLRHSAVWGMLKSRGLPSISSELLVHRHSVGGPLNGWDVAEALRAQDPESADATRQVSGGLFFPKPYNLAEIVDALLTHAGNKRFQN